MGRKKGSLNKKTIAKMELVKKIREIFDKHLIAHLLGKKIN